MNNGIKFLLVVFCLAAGGVNLFFGNFIICVPILAIGLGNLFLLLTKGNPDSFLTLGAYLLFLTAIISGAAGMLYGLRVFG